MPDPNTWLYFIRKDSDTRMCNKRLKQLGIKGAWLIKLDEASDEQRGAPYSTACMTPYQMHYNILLNLKFKFALGKKKVI